MCSNAQWPEISFFLLILFTNKKIKVQFTRHLPNPGSDLDMACKYLKAPHSEGGSDSLEDFRSSDHGHCNYCCTSLSVKLF